MRTPTLRAALLSVGIVLAASAADVSVSIGPLPDGVGQAVRVSWKGQSGRRVLWMGAGEQLAEGFRDVMPSNEGVSFLFETDSGFAFVHKQFPKPGQFPVGGGDTPIARHKLPLPKVDTYALHSFQGSAAPIDYASFCSELVQALQTGLGFELPAINADLNADGTVRALYFQTAWHRVRELQANLNRKFAERLVTFRIEADADKGTRIRYVIGICLSNFHPSDDQGEAEDAVEAYKLAYSLITENLNSVKPK